jgi:hypothetical protein
VVVELALIQMQLLVKLAFYLANALEEIMLDVVLLDLDLHGI